VLKRFSLSLLCREFTQDVRDLALEVPHASLVGITIDDQAQGFIRNGNLLFIQPVFEQLFRDKELAGDGEFFFFDVTREFNQFHAVQQSWRDGRDGVGSRDEKHLRKIVRNLKIVVRKTEVLLRVKHFQQCRGRIALEISIELIDLIQHEKRIDDFGFCHGLQDTPRQRADISAAMPANFGFVVHTTQRKADELAVHHFCNGFTH